MKRIVNIAAIAALLALVSCKDWIEPRSIDTYTPTLEDQNPELYAAYIKNLKDYKLSHHRVTIVTFDNPAKAPNGQGDRLTALPDSVDVVSLTSPATLGKGASDDIAAVREKGTRVVYDVNFPAMEKAWAAKVKEDATLTEKDAAAYFGTETRAALELCDKHGYDGITFTYSGSPTVGMKPAELEAYSARQDAFFGPLKEWRGAHADKFFSFIGSPANLVGDNAKFMNLVEYIILPTENVIDEAQITTFVESNVVDGVPADRFVVRQYMFDVDDKEGVKGGYLSTKDSEGNRLRSVPVAAAWVVKPSPSFERAGMMIMNVQLDYYQSRPTYANTRAAIGRMNP